ncbi:glycosyl hydrolase family 17 protein [Mycoplasmatota bacterium WC30]
MFKYGKAICYQGYRKGHSPILGICPTKEQVLEDLLILDQEFDYIRVYDTSLHTIDILEVIDEYKINIKVMISMYLFVEENHIEHPIFNSIDNNILEENIMKNNSLCKDVIDLANKFGDIIFSISVGNEARSTWNVNRVSDKRISELVKIIQKKVSQPVTFCEEWKYWLTDLPLTAAAADFISIHSYPVWNAVDIDTAISETDRHLEAVKNRYPNKNIIITEAGWPTKTDENKIPKEWATINNQTKYYQDMEVWAEKNQTIVFIFEAFDEPWKGSLNPTDPEKNWGLYYDDRSKKDKEWQ